VPAPHSLATRAVRGAFWTGSPFVLQIAISLVFYGYLEIGDMGQFEWALILVMLLALVTPLGLDHALVQRRDAADVHFSSAFWLSLALGLAVAGAVTATAPLTARYLGGEEPETFAAILRTMCWIVPFASVSGLLRARLQRDLQFRPIALAEVLSVVVYAASAGVLLARGYGAMSPVISAVVREAALFAGLAWGAAWRPRLVFSAAALRELLAFGLNFTGSRCVNYLNSNLPRFLIFPLLGDAALGFYSFAYRLTLMPLVRISTVITRVAFPAFATIQDDLAQLRRGYLRTVKTIGLSFWPVLAVLFAVAPEGCGLLRQLNDQDLTPALLPLRLLALAAVVKAVGTPVGSIFLARGKASWSFYWSLFSFAVLMPALYWGAGQGVWGVCAVIAISAVLFLGLSQHLANRLVEMGFATYLSALARPAAVTAALAAVLWVTRRILPASPTAALGLQVVAAAVAGLALLRLLAWSDLAELWRDVRGRGNVDASSSAAPDPHSQA